MKEKARELMVRNKFFAAQQSCDLRQHLDSAALLMPDRIRERWKDFVDELSAYYNTPGRLAVFRRQFENVRHRPLLLLRNWVFSPYADSLT